MELVIKSSYKIKPNDKVSLYLITAEQYEFWHPKDIAKHLNISIDALKNMAKEVGLTITIDSIIYGNREHIEKLIGNLQPFLVMKKLML